MNLYQVLILELKNTYINKFFSNMWFIIGVRVVGVHILDSSKYTLRIEGVIVLHNVISHHNIKKWPTHIVIRCQSLVFIWNIGKFLKYCTKQARNFVSDYERE